MHICIYMQMYIVLQNPGCNWLFAEGLDTLGEEQGLGIPSGLYQGPIGQFRTYTLEREIIHS